MAQQTINIGASPNDGTGTPLRTAFQYTNSNFSELYTAVGPSGNNIVVPGNATITGNLTVDTSTLKVDSANNRVGINTASPALPFVVSNAGAQGFEINPNGSIVSGGIDILSYNRSTSLYKGAGFAAESYLFRVGTVSATDAMTLNSTGLGVGASPGYKLHVGGYSSANIAPDAALVRSSSGTTIQSGPNLLFSDGTSVNNVVLQNTQGRFGIWNYGAGVWNERLSVDASGNVGIGVTPSAWAAAFKPVQIGSGTVSSAFIGQTNSPVARIMTNSYFDGTNFVKVQNNTAGMYVLSNNQHEWHNAVTGTGTFSFVQAMTLDASGNLLVGTTTAPTLGKLHVSNGIQVSGSGAGGFITSRDGTDQNAYLSLGSNFGVANSYDIGLAIANIAAAAGKRITITNRTAGVYLDDGGTSWNAVSDERFKDIIEPISNAVSKVGLLRSVIGKLKTDDASKRRSFLIAQDVQTVLPEAVDASNPDQLGLAYTDIIPLLVAAIKELTARVQTLETR